MRLGVLAFLLFAGVVSGQEQNIDIHSLLSTLPTDELQVAVLTDLAESNDHVELLQRPAVDKKTNIVVPLGQKQKVMTTLTENGVQVTDLSPKLQAHTRKVRSATSGIVQQSRGRCKTPKLFPTHTSYYRLADIEQFMSSWASCYPRIARKKQLPYKTYEGRTVHYMEIGLPFREVSAFWGTPIIMIEALAHPREWVATAATLYAIDKLLSDFENNDPRVQKYLKKFGFVIIPVVNPDGYVHTWTKDRLWRRNRRVINESCIGVDVNRNFDVKFGTVGVTKTCGSITYPGEKPFSEAESKNIKYLFEKHYGRMHAFISVHAFSKLLIYPWVFVENEYSADALETPKEVEKVGEDMIKDLDGYLLGTAVETIGYAASGVSIDWALKQKNDIYSYCYELRPGDMEEYGFELPESQIIPTGKEFTRSLLTMIKSSTGQ